MYVKGDDRFKTIPASNDIALQREIVYVRDYIMLFLRLLVSKGLNRSGQYQDPYLKWWEGAFPSGFSKMKTLFKDREKLGLVSVLLQGGEKEGGEGTLQEYSHRTGAKADRAYHRDAEKFAEATGLQDLVEDNDDEFGFRRRQMMSLDFEEPVELLPKDRFEKRMGFTVGFFLI